MINQIAQFIYKEDAFISYQKEKRKEKIERGCFYKRITGMMDVCSSPWWWTSWEKNFKKHQQLNASIGNLPTLPSSGCKSEGVNTVLPLSLSLKEEDEFPGNQQWEVWSSLRRNVILSTANHCRYQGHGYGYQLLDWTIHHIIYQNMNVERCKKENCDIKQLSGPSLRCFLLAQGNK